jgi:hypothetical protein
MSSRRSSSKRDQQAYGGLYLTHVPPLISLLDTHNLQIHRPKTHILENKEAPKIRREESREPSRTDNTGILPTTALGSKRPE